MHYDDHRSSLERLLECHPPVRHDPERDWRSSAAAPSGLGLRGLVDRILAAILPAAVVLAAADPTEPAVTAYDPDDEDGWVWDDDEPDTDAETADRSA
jgi:hypothetical protein